MTKLVDENKCVKIALNKKSKTKPKLMICTGFYECIKSSPNEEINCDHLGIHLECDGCSPSFCPHYHKGWISMYNVECKAINNEK